VLTPLEGLGDFVENAHVLFSLDEKHIRLCCEPGGWQSEHDAIPQNTG
jgi:hypothetical protein